MKFLSGLPLTLAALFSIHTTLQGNYLEDALAAMQTSCNEEIVGSEEPIYEEGPKTDERINGNILPCFEESQDSTGCVRKVNKEPCEEEHWCHEICYEPMYYTVQKCVEKQIPTKKKCSRIVPKEYKIQKVRYVPEYYTDTITKNEVEYFFVDDWKTSTEMTYEKKCEWVPRSTWKKLAPDPCECE